MTKVHPNAIFPTKSFNRTFVKTPSFASQTADAVVLTVWKRSLLFNCNGFTVYDSKGNLVFRVDNYMSSSGTHGEVVLMDAAGKPLLTVRRKRMSLGDNWMVYDGETTVNPRFSARKNANVLNTKCLAHVSAGRYQAENYKKVMYAIEGSYSQRSCVVYNDMRQKVVEIKQKEAVNGVAYGGEVFQLVVKPGFDVSVAMALVILLDKMFGSSRRFFS